MFYIIYRDDRHETSDEEIDRRHDAVTESERWEFEQNKDEKNTGYSLDERVLPGNLRFTLATLPHLPEEAQDRHELYPAQCFSTRKAPRSAIHAHSCVVSERDDIEEAPDNCSEYEREEDDEPVHAVILSCPISVRRSS